MVVLDYRGPKEEEKKSFDLLVRALMKSSLQNILVWFKEDFSKVFSDIHGSIVEENLKLSFTKSYREGCIEGVLSVNIEGSCCQPPLHQPGHREIDYRRLFRIEV